MKTKSLEIEVSEDDILGWVEGSLGDRLPTLNYDAWAVEEIFSCPDRVAWAIVLKAREGEGESP